LHSAAKPQPHWTSCGRFEFSTHGKRSERPPWDVKLWFRMNTTASNRDGLPESFLAQFGEHVTGFLSGFDRLRFRATLRPLFQPGGLEIYLSCCKVLIKDFGSFAQKLTDRIKKKPTGCFAKLNVRFNTCATLKPARNSWLSRWPKTTLSGREQLFFLPVWNRACRSRSEGIARPSGYGWFWSTPNARISIIIISIPTLD
jgi:hypothetical protein